jgi:hypothetical protein
MGGVSVSTGTLGPGLIGTLFASHIPDNPAARLNESENVSVCKVRVNYVQYTIATACRVVNRTLYISINGR